MKRPIVDFNNNYLGELELPDGTSEEVWQKKLNAYKIDPATAVIPDVTPRQMRSALILSGVSIPTIEAAINSLPEPYNALAMVEWEYSLAFKRKNPLVDSIGVIIGWNSAQVDELWKLAYKL